MHQLAMVNPLQPTLAEAPGKTQFQVGAGLSHSLVGSRWR